MGSATNHGLGLIGSAAAYGATQNYNPAAAQAKQLQLNQQAQQAQYNAMRQQSQYAQQQQLLQQYNQAYERKKWMLDGKEMSFEEFIDTLYPEDSPEKTFMILKLKGND